MNDKDFPEDLYVGKLLSEQLWTAYIDGKMYAVEPTYKKAFEVALVKWRVEQRKKEPCHKGVETGVEK